MVKAWKIKLTPMTPFLIGNQRQKDNYYETLDYIPAQVVQAAFARAILETHRDFRVRNSQEPYYIDSKESPYDLNGARPEWRNWLEHFSDLSFTDALPLGAFRYTPTTYQCKTHPDNHPLQETLPLRYLISQNKVQLGEQLEPLSCPDCGGGRMERRDGWAFPERKRVYKRVVTRIGLNPRRLTAEDEQLYQIVCGEPYAYIDREKGISEPLYFEALCYAPDDQVELNISADQNVHLHVGAYITSGMGLMKVEVEPYINERSISEIVHYWRQRVDNHDTAAVELLSDLPVVNHQVDQKYFSYDEYQVTYTNYLRNYSNLPHTIKVDFSYLQYEHWRGFSQSKAGLRHNERRLVIKKGSIFVVRGNQSELDHWLKQVCHEGLPIESTERKIRIPIIPISGTEVRKEQSL